MEGGGVEHPAFAIGEFISTIPTGNVVGVMIFFPAQNITTMLFAVRTTFPEPAQCSGYGTVRKDVCTWCRECVSRSPCHGKQTKTHTRHARDRAVVAPTAQALYRQQEKADGPAPTPESCVLCCVSACHLNQIGAHRQKSFGGKNRVI